MTESVPGTVAHALHTTGFQLGVEAEQNRILALITNAKVWPMYEVPEDAEVGDTLIHRQMIDREVLTIGIKGEEK